MSKIGRKPIKLKNIKVELQGQEIHYKAPKESGVYVLPSLLTVRLSEDKNELFIEAKKGVKDRDLNRLWGLHRALIANKIYGLSDGFERQLIITGLGFKALISGSKVQFALGYSHKINFVLPQGVVMETDKTGQKLTLRSHDKALLGQVSSYIRSLRKTEPYKGTGIKFENEIIFRKAGKAKA